MTVNDAVDIITRIYIMLYDVGNLLSFKVNMFLHSEKRGLIDICYS